MFFFRYFNEPHAANLCTDTHDYPSVVGALVESTDSTPIIIKE